VPCLDDTQATASTRLIMRLKLVGWLGAPRLSRQHLSIAQAQDECARYYSQHSEMSWRTALTVLTVLTLVARCSTPS
jgi:hypothetical protein